jgi:uncharacterized protein YjbI with pentapeptide repeats
MPEESEVGQIEPFVRHGTEEAQIEVSADEVLTAIAEEREIDIQWAFIKGDLDIQKIKDRIVDEDEVRIQSAIGTYGCKIEGYAFFEGATFRERVSFEGAAFRERVSFKGAAFRGHACFRGVTFGKYVSFEGTTFRGGASFVIGTFSRGVSFYSATFSGDVYFPGATCRGDASFEGTTFRGGASFVGATFREHVSFQRATCRGGVYFDGTKIKYPADFSNVRFRENPLGEEETRTLNDEIGALARKHGKDLITFYCEEAIALCHNERDLPSMLIQQIAEMGRKAGVTIMFSSKKLV